MVALSWACCAAMLAKAVLKVEIELSSVEILENVALPKTWVM